MAFDKKKPEAKKKPEVMPQTAEEKKIAIENAIAHLE